MGGAHNFARGEPDITIGFWCDLPLSTNVANDKSNKFLL